MADRIVILKEGIIQQVGSPREVYNDPANTFVATFIGSPSMNLLDAEVVDERGAIFAKGQGFSLPLSGDLADRARNADEKEIKIGLRPEHFGGRQAEGSHAPLDLKVLVSEYIGSSQFLTAEIGGASIAAAIDVGPDAELLSDGEYYFDTRRLYMFERSSGRAI